MEKMKRFFDCSISIYIVRSATANDRSTFLAIERQRDRTRHTKKKIIHGKRNVRRERERDGEKLLLAFEKIMFKLKCVHVFEANTKLCNKYNAAHKLEPMFTRHQMSIVVVVGFGSSKFFILQSPY